MKKNFYYLSVALMAAMFFVSCSSSDDNGSQGGNGGNGDKPRTDVVDYTVMFYSCGGFNLDAATEDNWGEALNGLEINDPNVRYMVQFKYSGQKNLDKYNPGRTWGGKAAQCYRFELTHNKYNYQQQLGGGRGRRRPRRFPCCAAATSRRRLLCSLCCFCFYCRP